MRVGDDDNGWEVLVKIIILLFTDEEIKAQRGENFPRSHRVYVSPRSIGVERKLEPTAKH